MRNILMALAFLGFSSFALACPCKEKMELKCPECKSMSMKDEAYKDKKLTGSDKPKCEKCEKVKKEESKED
ncbi:hypothetical protein SAMN06265182_1457 [Persephonella hydrogeniphila]|uniref:Uncharacterized protein n=1 Tax=Persephonella hydrogeniphila TaxID=198703 RepID=A0A285NHS6_9AQUI|nr:hypothetical protein [Persephonella hydrogeniphila]SNZ09030.1 hypothetical protein SAMN06265182_1457 [Persephonella hydrogeniphila]